MHEPDRFGFSDIRLEIRLIETARLDPYDNNVRVRRKRTSLSKASVVRLALPFLNDFQISKPIRMANEKGAKGH